MKNRNPKHRLVSLLVSVVFIISLLPVFAVAADYSDISGHWAKDAIVRWSDYGVLKGSDGKFRPDDTVTRAELAAILNRMLKYPAQTENPYTGIKSSDWFYNDVLSLATYDICAQRQLCNQAERGADPRGSGVYGGKSVRGKAISNSIQRV